MSGVDEESRLLLDSKNESQSELDDIQSLINQGLAACSRGDHVTELDMMQRAYQIASDTVPSSDLWCQAVTCLSVAYLCLGQYDQYEKLYEIIKASQSQDNVRIKLFLSLGKAEAVEKDNSKFFSLFKSLEPDEEYSISAADRFFKLGNMCSVQNFMSKSLIYLKRAEEIYDACSNRFNYLPESHLTCLLDLAEQIRRAQNFEESFKYLLKAEQINKQYGQNKPSEIQARLYELLSDHYLTKNEQLKMLTYKYKAFRVYVLLDRYLIDKLLDKEIDLEDKEQAFSLEQPLVKAVAKIKQDLIEKEIKRVKVNEMSKRYDLFLYQLGHILLILLVWTCALFDIYLSVLYFLKGDYGIPIFGLLVIFFANFIIMEQTKRGKLKLSFCKSRLKLFSNDWDKVKCYHLIKKEELVVERLKCIKSFSFIKTDHWHAKEYELKSIESISKRLIQTFLWHQIQLIVQLVLLNVSNDQYPNPTIDMIVLNKRIPLNPSSISIIDYVRVTSIVLHLTCICANGALFESAFVNNTRAKQIGFTDMSSILLVRFISNLAFLSSRLIPIVLCISSPSIFLIFLPSYYILFRSFLITKTLKTKVGHKLSRKRRIVLVMIKHLILIDRLRGFNRFYFFGGHLLVFVESMAFYLIYLFQTEFKKDCVDMIMTRITIVFILQLISALLDLAKNKISAEYRLDRFVKT